MSVMELSDEADRLAGVLGVIRYPEGAVYAVIDNDSVSLYRGACTEEVLQMHPSRLLEAALELRLGAVYTLEEGEGG